MIEKLKSFLLNDHIFYGILVVLVGISSFGLGRASVENIPLKTQNLADFEPKMTVQSNKLDIVNTQNATAINPNDNLVEELVASKSGTKYHLVTCPGAKQIKEENKIYFSSRSEALSAGYKPASNCPGLQ